MKRAITLLWIALRPNGIRWYAVCMERAIAYLRVSTERQQRSGLGIDAQRAAIERFANAESLAIAAEFVEFESGKGADALEKRPQLAAELGRDADPFMLHLYAALAEKERGLISERTRGALAVMKAAGARLGNPHNLDHAGSLGRAATARAAAEFASGLTPVIQTIRAMGALTLASITAELNG